MRLPVFLASLALFTGAGVARAQTTAPPDPAPVAPAPPATAPAPVAPVAAPEPAVTPAAAPEPAATPAATPMVRDTELADAPAKRELLAPEYPPPNARVSVALAGTAVFAAWYGLGVGASLLWPDAPGAKDLRIPVAGPWLALEHTGCPSRGDCDEITVVLRAIATVIDGVGQLGGVLAVGEAVFLRTETTSGERRAPAPKAAVRPFPFRAGQDGIGLGLAGAF